MPRGDGTGPQGQGPLTGRGMGPCGGYDTPRRPRLGRGLGLGLGRGLGRGLGFGRGLGRGMGRGLGLGGGRGYGSRLNAPGWWATGMAPEDDLLGPDEEKTLLKNESRRLKSVLEDIDKRLEQLGSDNK